MDGAAARAEQDGGWQRLRPTTLVERVTDEIIAAASRGDILPGDRIVETELAERLGISRVPVREALRLLESQGVVVNTPYKGIRLVEVTPERVDHLIEARVALETSAAQRAIRLGHNAATGALSGCIEAMDLMRQRKDASGFAAADTEFHRQLCALGGNRVVAALWESLARQMTIFFGLSTLHKPMKAIAEEHRVLLRVLRSGDEAAVAAEIEDHIRVQTRAVDFDRLISRRRRERDGA